MRLILAILILALTSCQDYNSNSGDRGRYGPVVLDESDPNFEKAYNIIQTSCVSCHDQEHDRWADFKTNADWLAAGYIDQANPTDSQIIRRIINTGTTESNMPPGGSPLSNDEYNHLIKWVTEFQ